MAYREPNHEAKTNEGLPHRRDWLSKRWSGCKSGSIVIAEKIKRRQLITQGESKQSIVRGIVIYLLGQ